MVITMPHRGRGRRYWTVLLVALAWAVPGAADDALQPGPEVLERRTADSRHFALGGGHYQAWISATPVHYLDDQGSWQNIDTRLTKRGSAGFAAEQNGLRVLLAERHDGEITLVRRPRSLEELRASGRTAAGWAVRMRPMAVRWSNAMEHRHLDRVEDAGAAVADGGVLSFGEIAPGVVASYRVLPDALRYELSVTEPLHCPKSFEGGDLEVVWSLHLPDGAALLSGDGWISRTLTTSDPVEVVGRDGSTLLVLTAPVARDSTRFGEVLPGVLTLRPDELGWTLAASIPARWVTESERRLPIEMTSSATIDPPSGDILISPAFSVPQGLLHEIWVGFDGTTPYRSLLSWIDLTAIPPYALLDGDSDDDGKIRLYVTGSWGDGASQLVRAYRVTDFWTEADATWTHASSSLLWSTPGGDFETLLGLGWVGTATGYTTISGVGIRDTVALWRTFFVAEPTYLYGIDPYGVLLKLPDPESGHDVKFFASREDPAAGRTPLLVVNYEDGPVALADKAPLRRCVPSPDYFSIPSSGLWRAVGIRPTSGTTNFDLRVYQNDTFGLMGQQSTRGAGEVDVVVVNGGVMDGAQYPFVFSPFGSLGSYWYEYASRTAYFGGGIDPEDSYGPYDVGTTTVVRMWTFYETAGTEMCVEIRPTSGDARLGAAVFDAGSSYGNLSTAVASGVAATDGGPVAVTFTTQSTGVYGLLVWSKGGSGELTINGCPPGLIFRDGFEIGGTSFWSSAMP